MRLASGLILCVFLASACAADPPPKKDPPKASAVKLDLGKPLTAPVGKRLVVAAVTTAARVTWELPPGVDGLPLDGKRLALWAPPGTYVVRGMVPSGEDVLSDEVVVTVTGPRPPPVPPEPKPPEPPKPDPAPIPAPGLHVLVVYESGDTLSAAQNTILYGKAVRDYLEAKCAVGPDGRTRQYRIWDKDTDGYGDSKLWGDAMKRGRASVPWVVVSNPGVGGYEGPLPESAEKFLELVGKYSGGK